MKLPEDLEGHEADAPYYYNHLKRAYFNPGISYAGLIEALLKRRPTGGKINYVSHTSEEARYSVGSTSATFIKKDHESEIIIQSSNCAGWSRIRESVSILEKFLGIKLNQTAFEEDSELDYNLWCWDSSFAYLEKQEEEPDESGLHEEL